MEFIPKKTTKKDKDLEIDLPMLEEFVSDELKLGLRLWLNLDFLGYKNYPNFHLKNLTMIIFV